jgi:geranylgeranyl pyrophosphate synthase
MIDALDRYGLNIGIAFQIQDDIFDFTAKNENYGKKIGQDIFENKKTYPIIKAKELAFNDEDKDFVKSYFNNKMKPNEENIEKFIDLFNRLDIFEIANTEINKYVSAAAEQLKMFEKNEYVTMLELFLDKILNRTY